MEFIQVNEKYIPDEGYYFGNGLFEKKGVPLGKTQNFWLNFLRATVRPNKAPLSL